MIVPNHSDNWSADQLRFQLWLALPKAERRPKTQKALANEIGVCEDTLTDWKNLPGFRDAVNRLARELVKDDVPEVLATIRRMARAGSVSHLNMFLSMAGLQTDVANAGKGPIGLNDEQRIDRAVALFDRARARRAGSAAGDSANGELPD